MTSKAERKRRKRKYAAKLPELAPIEQKQQHRVNGKFAKEPESGNLEALEARKRVCGIRVAHKDLGALYGAPWMGEPIGWVMEERKLPADKKQELWQTWKGLEASKETYRRRKLGKSVHAKGASIASVPDPFRTDEASSIDTRSDEEKLNAAAKVYKHWQVLLGRLASEDRRLLNEAVDHDGAALWYDSRSTKCGRATLDALERLAKVVGK